MGVVGLGIENALGIQFAVGGLTPIQRQVLFGISIALVSAGALATRSGLSPLASFVFVILGTVGMAYKVALGSSTTQ